MLFSKFLKGGNRVYGRIKSIAKEKGIPIYKMEDELGISRGSICKWNTVKPSYDKVVGVSKILGVPIEELLGGE